MKYTTFLFVLIAYSSLIACGGGGSSASGGGDVAVVNPTPVPTTTPTTTVPVVVEPEPTLAPTPEPVFVEPNPDAVYDSTAELIVPSVFTFEQEYPLSVEVSIAANRKAYISICSDFNREGDGVTVNYDSCLLRTSIEGDFNGELTVPNDKSTLVMAIWYLDEPESPRFEEWQKSDGSNTEEMEQFIVN